MTWIVRVVLPIQQPDWLWKPTGLPDPAGQTCFMPSTFWARESKWRPEIVQGFLLSQWNNAVQDEIETWSTCRLEVVVIHGCWPCIQNRPRLLCFRIITCNFRWWTIFPCDVFSLRGKQHAAVPRLKLKPLHWPLLCLAVQSPRKSPYLNC